MIEVRNAEADPQLTIAVFCPPEQTEKPRLTYSTSAASLCLIFPTHFTSSLWSLLTDPAAPSIGVSNAYALDECNKIAESAKILHLHIVVDSNVSIR